MMTKANFLWILLALCFISTGHALANSSSQLLILGLGRVGLEVARRAAPHFYSVAGTVRAPTEQQSPDDAIQKIPCSPSEIRPRLADISHVLVTIPAVGEEGLDAVFDAVVQGLEPGCWLGLVSTTGVYGNYDGEWVTEESACRPEADTTASQFLEYEAAWCQRATNHGHHLSIFRCAGIYGPTRSALHTVFKKGTHASTPNNNDQPVKDLTNRIHEHDLSQAVLGSMLQGKHPLSPACDIYNLADDQPESRSVVLGYASNLLKSINVSVETRSSAAEGTSGRARRRRTDQKRVRNQKMRDVILPSMLYPTYKEGLEAILADPDSPWHQNTLK
jgi:nucleoside-diphosphate-sugar epimerase